MGGGGSKIAMLEVEAGSLVTDAIKQNKAISPANVMAAKTKVSLSLKYDMSVKDTGAMMDETGSVLMTFKSTPGGFGRKMTLMVYDASGKVLCMAAGKDNFTKYSFQVFKPTPSYAKQSADEKMKLEDGADCYLFAKGEIDCGMAKGKGTYSIVKADAEGDAVETKLYEFLKPRGMVFAMTVENVQGALVAKMVQPGMDPKKILGEIGSAVDSVAMLVITNMLADATGGGMYYGYGAGIAAGV